MENTNDRRVQWHPACYAALNLEFMEDKHELEISQEHAINELPLRVDILIIKKRRKSNIKNEIGKIFRAHNLVEYKSPEDELSFDAFLKGIAEVYLYKVCGNAESEIQIDDVTLTFIRKRKPKKLFKILEYHDFLIQEKFQGIYYVSGRNIIPIQIVVSQELGNHSHRWLNSLTKKLSRTQAEELVIVTNGLLEAGDKKFADAVWEIVTRANRGLIEKMKEDEKMCKAMAEIFKPEIDAAFDDGFNNGIDDKGIQVFKNMINRGFSVKDAQSLAEISDELVEKALAECK